MPSRRLHWDRSPNRVWLEWRRLLRSGRDVIDLTGSNPVAAGLSLDRADVLAGLDQPGLARYDPDPRGHRAAREAIVATYEGRGVAPSPDDVFLTSGTSEAYAFLFKFLGDPGDTVLVPSPSYPLLEHLVALEGLVARPYRLRYDGRWHIDLDELRKALEPDGVCAVVIVHPNNPTGSFVCRGEAETIAHACHRAGAAIVSDEVFSSYSFRDDPDRLTTFAGETRVPTFVLDGLSKSIALPQVKLGWFVVTGPDRERRRNRAGLEWILDAYLPVSVPVQLAVPAWLAGAETVRERIRARLRRNLESLRSFVRGTPAGVLDVEGGWTAILRVPAVRSAEDRCIDLMREDGVRVQPGFFYDLDGDAHLVVSLLTPPDLLDRGVRAIVRDARRGD